MQKIGLIFFILLTSFGSYGQKERRTLGDMLSQASFKAFNESCRDFRKTGGKALCERDLNPVKNLQDTANEISSSTYLSALAAERVKDETCAIDFISSLDKDKAKSKFPEFAKSTLNKTQALVDEMYGLMVLRTELLKASKEKQPAIRQEVEKATLRVAILENSIPLGNQKALGDLVMSYVEKAIPATINKPTKPPPILETEFNAKLEKALAKTKQSLSADREVYDKGSQDSSKLKGAQKEVLAQDTYLVESYHARNPNLNLQNVACDVDSKFGLGAERRDQIILGGTIVASIGSMGLGLGAKALALSTSLPARVAAVSGMVTAQSARAISLLSISAESMLAMQAISKSCQGKISDTQVRTNSNKANRCEGFTTEDTKIQDCYTVGALAALGAVSGASALVVSNSAIQKVGNASKMMAGETAQDRFRMLLKKSEDINPATYNQWRRDLGPATSEAIDIAVSEDRGADVVKIFRTESSDLGKSRKSLEKIRSEISQKAAKSSNADQVSPFRIESERQVEASKLGSLKTYRASVDDVIETRTQYPALGKTIDDYTDKLKNNIFLPKVTSAREIPGFPTKYLAAYEDADPKVQKAMADVWNRLNDPEAFARHTKALAEDAAVEMRKSGSVREIDALSRGELTDTGVLKTLVKRQKAQGADKFYTVKDFDGDNFQRTVTQGPFFDKAFKDTEHSMAAHMIQRDYVADVIWKATDGNPKIFWDFMGSKETKGQFWEKLFDSTSQTLSSPEYYSNKVQDLLRTK